MKRIFAIMAAVCLCCALTVPTFAADYNGTELPDIETVWKNKDTYPVAVVVQDINGNYSLVLAQSCNDNSSISRFFFDAPYCIYSVNTTKDSWTITDFYPDDDWSEVLGISSYVWSSSPILNGSGDIIFENPSFAPEPILSVAIPSDSLTGALGEVTGILVIALPVVAGLFGIRKGIAFLISRVRGA